MRICNSFCISNLRVKWQKSDNADSVNAEKDKDLTLLTLI